MSVVPAPAAMYALTVESVAAVAVISPALVPPDPVARHRMRLTRMKD